MHMHKILILLIAIIGVLTLGFFGYNYFQTNLQQNKRPTESAFSNLIDTKTQLKAQVTYLTGTAWRMENGRKVQLLEEDVVNEGTTVVTDATTRIVFEFDDGSIIRLGDNTTITLSQLSSSQILLDENKGILYARVNKDENHKFTVKAGKYTIDSLGTAFSVENDAEVKVKVFDSKVKVSDSTNATAETEVKANQQWQETEKTVKELATAEISGDKFLAWNTEKDKDEDKTEKTEPTVTLTPKSTPTPTEQTTGSIKLEGHSTDNGVYLKWSTDNLSEAKGFKVVKSLDSNPKYPGSYYTYFEGTDIKSFTWEITDGKAWHFRVCQYLEDGTCGKYSNEITVTAPKSDDDTTDESDDSGDVKSIDLSISKSGDNAVKLEWDTEGKSDLGFKVVWSKKSGPTYPTRDGDNYHYLSDSDADSDKVEDLDSGKKYYFRVCEYLGGKCGKYSNEKSLTL